jgi:hypothetical protein
MLSLYRLNELFGAVLHVLLNRAKHDYVSGRKMGLTLLAYVEPILTFAVLHAMIATVVPCCPAAGSAEVYAFTGRAFSGCTFFYFSASCYTTVGWGDVTAVHPAAMFASSIESIFGLLMLALTVSTFVSRTYK